MSDALKNSKKRLAVLEAEIKQIQLFIKMYEEFAAVDAAHDEQTATMQNDAVSCTTKTPDAVEKSPRRRRAGPAPREIVDMAARMILEAGRPLSRGEIAERFDARDVELAATDKPRYIGTIMWRNKSKFLQIEGRGYWLRGEPVPKTPSAEELGL